MITFDTSHCELRYFIFCHIEVYSRREKKPILWEGNFQIACVGFLHMIVLNCKRNVPFISVNTFREEGLVILYVDYEVPVSRNRSQKSHRKYKSEN
jgi:hypothetical protein